MKAHRFSRGSAVFAAVATIAIICAACSSSSTASTTTTSGSSNSTSGAQTVLNKYLVAPTTIAQTAPLPSAPPKGKTLIYLTQENVPTTAAIGSAAQAASTSVGWNFSEISYDPANPSSLVSAFANALLKHPTVVAVTGIDPSDYASTLANYKAAGVPIVVTSGVPTPIVKPLIGLVDDHRQNEAQAVASWVTVDSKGAGQILLAHVTGFPSLDAVATAFTTDVKALCSGCSVKTVDIPVSEAESGGENAQVVSTLRDNPSYTYLVFDDGDFATGINSALSAAGLNSIKVAGMNMQPEQADAIRSGTQSAWTADNNSITGYDIVDVAARWVLNVPIGTKDQSEPTQLLTKSNIGSTTMWNEPPNALQQYETLWKVSGS